MVAGPAAAALSGKLLEMPILGPFPDLMSHDL